MPFNAINIEPEDTLVDEVDVVRQMQIGEALKQFQCALKLHAQGPQFYDRASAAYDHLFDSVIFQYPDAATDYEQASRPSPHTQFDLLPQDPDGSLPQALYLCHKNRGQFLIDQIQHEARLRGQDAFDAPDLRKRAQRSLEHFVAALDRDPADAELWRRTARLAMALESGRISRFCLEAAIEMDDDPVLSLTEPPAIAETLAGEVLRTYLQKLEDQTALSHPSMEPWVEKKLPPLLRKHLDPFPALPDPVSVTCTAPTIRQSQEPHSRSLSVLQPTWTGIGNALLEHTRNSGFLGSKLDIKFECPLALFSTKDDDEQSEQETLQDRKRQEGDAKGAHVTANEHAAQTSGQAGRVKPQEAAAEASETPLQAPAAKSAEARESTVGEHEQSSRKRSQLTACLLDEEFEFKRSKRVRRRETAEDSTEPAKRVTASLEPCQAADRNLFEMTRDLLRKLDVANDADVMGRIKEVLDTCATENRTAMKNQAALLVRDSIKAFSDEKAKMFLKKKDPQPPNLDAFLDDCNARMASSIPMFQDRGVMRFAEMVNDGFYCLEEVMLLWVGHVMKSYCSTRWPDTLKQTVLDMLCHFNDSILLSETITGDIVQAIFEMHLDAYHALCVPDDDASDINARAVAKNRLEQWCRRAFHEPRTIRFLWALAQTIKLDEDVSREHIIQTWVSVHEYMTDELVWLPNSKLMPEISPAAAEREISRLTTMDFFHSLRSDMEPLAAIDSLEPVLAPDLCEVDGKPVAQVASRNLRDLWKLVAKGSVELRIFLWERLAAAYGNIGYTPREFSCRLKALEVVVDALEGPDRCLIFFRYIDDILIPTLSAAINEPDAFELVDANHTRETAVALVKLACMLHMASLVDDELRFGILTAPHAKTFESFMVKFRDLQVRLWSFLYCVLKAGMRFDNNLELMAAIHQVLGLRRICKGSNKIFLKFMRNELFRSDNLEQWPEYVGPVLHDLYGLKLGVVAGLYDVQDHGCPPDKLECRTAISIAQRIASTAHAMSIKDLLKSDLKTTIEMMETAIGQVKSTPQIILNIRKVNDTLRSPIHPLRLQQAMVGNLAVDAVTIHSSESPLAKVGWFFLLGKIALSKFKAIDLNKRQTPGAIDDLRMATTHLRHQLQFTPEKWEVWYRLGECHDYELDEMVLWSAEKMNKDHEDLIRLQRSTIHCYALATSCAANYATAEDEDALGELYFRFGMRLYASSRKPFAMKAFQHTDQQRYILGADGNPSKSIIHSQMSTRGVWKHAANLFRRAMIAKPKDWQVPYMLAKCQWKLGNTANIISLLQRSVELASQVKRSRGSDPILEPAYKVVSITHKLVMRGEILPREGARILLRLSFMERVELGTTLTPPDEDPNDPTETWQQVVIMALRKLEDMDKANWQHRIVARHANILVDADPNSTLQANLAFTVLRDTMFTKTMAMNVWKCEAERPGRHFVYMEQYVRLIVRIFCTLSDRSNLEILLRRLRKRGVDFYNFHELWQHCCVTYVSILRMDQNLVSHLEDGFCQFSPEGFELITEQLCEWAAKNSTPNPESGSPASILTTMKDAWELKKLNSSLMKSQVIDDLISDCMMKLWATVKVSLTEPMLDRTLDQNGVLASETVTVNGEVSDAAAVDSAPAAVEKETSKSRRLTVKRQDILRAAERIVAKVGDGKPGAVSAHRRTSASKSNRASPVPSDHDVTMNDAGNAGLESDSLAHNAADVSDEHGKGARQDNHAHDGDESRFADVSHMEVDMDHRDQLHKPLGRSHLLYEMERSSPPVSAFYKDTASSHADTAAAAANRPLLTHVPRGVSQIAQPGLLLHERVGGIDNTDRDTSTATKPNPSKTHRRTRSQHTIHGGAKSVSSRRSNTMDPLIAQRPAPGLLSQPLPFPQTLPQNLQQLADRVNTAVSSSPPSALTSLSPQLNSTKKKPRSEHAPNAIYAMPITTARCRSHAEKPTVSALPQHTANNGALLSSSELTDVEELALMQGLDRGAEGDDEATDSEAGLEYQHRHTGGIGDEVGVDLEEEEEEGEDDEVEGESAEYGEVTLGPEDTATMMLDVEDVDDEEDVGDDEDEVEVEDDDDEDGDDDDDDDDEEEEEEEEEEDNEEVEAAEEEEGGYEDDVEDGVAVGEQEDDEGDHENEEEELEEDVDEDGEDNDEPVAATGKAAAGRNRLTIEEHEVVDEADEEDDDDENGDEDQDQDEDEERIDDEDGDVVDGDEEEDDIEADNLPTTNQLIDEDGDTRMQHEPL